jgi:hypothetical protein
LLLQRYNTHTELSTRIVPVHHPLIVALEPSAFYLDDWILRTRSVSKLLFISQLASYLSFQLSLARQQHFVSSHSHSWAWVYNFLIAFSLLPVSSYATLHTHEPAERWRRRRQELMIPLVTALLGRHLFVYVFAMHSCISSGSLLLSEHTYIYINSCELASLPARLSYQQRGNQVLFCPHKT